MVFPCGSAGKESACNVGDLSSIPGLAKSPGEGNSYLLQYSGLENVYVCVCMYVYIYIYIWTYTCIYVISCNIETPHSIGHIHIW